ncbi:MAG: YmdB family metallophosphoesterase [Lentisphaerae bacterium]|nr:YmdB family metallophosphoesterase [Lentisphaerota bacterium]
MRVLMVGDVVGGVGRRFFATVAAKLRREGRVHAIVVNAENSAAGNGITKPLAQELFDAGADVITMGDHTWGQKGTELAYAGEKRLLRPANFTPDCPGNGWVVVQTPLGPLAVLNLVGRVFMSPVDCPFRQADASLKAMPGGVVSVVDFHAEATSEKIAMGLYLDGRVSAVAGTHTHVQTSDAQVLPNGTGYITDLGMTGPTGGVLGRDAKPVLQKFTTGMPSRFSVAETPAVLEGAIFEFDSTTRRCLKVAALRIHESRGGE